MIFLLILAVVLGAAISIYMPMNGAIAKVAGSPIVANVLFYFVGLLTSLALLGVFGDVRAILKLKNLPPFLLLTGVMSALMVLGTIFLLPQLGASKLFLLQIVGQIIMAMIVSHFGLLESPQDPITPQKFIGAALLIAGAIITVARF
ncbi:MAG: DMT family transporter [Chloroflexi bacterium]|nr:DMT family transporter [Chloroflexota bacterium]